jgi:predicted NBD/HSP70 family sugar kinase
MVVNNTSHVKLSNIELVRTALLERKDTKARLSERTGLSPATCSTIVKKMVESAEAIPAGEAAASGGRPAQVYRYNPHYAHVLGIYATNEAGVDRVVSATFTSTGEPLQREEIRPPLIDPEIMESAIEEHLGRDPLIKAVGIGVPAIVHGGIIGRGDILRLQGIPLAERVRARFGVAAVVENDMNVTAYGYYQEHARELDSLAAVMLPRGNGPGTGIVVDGKILRGHGGFAGEVHFLPENYNPLFQEPEDEPAFVHALARMLATITALVDPQRILLTGELVKPAMMEPLASACRQVIPPEHCPELVHQADCSREYLEGLRLKAHESLRYQYRLISQR